MLAVHPFLNVSVAVAAKVHFQDTPAVQSNDILPTVRVDVHPL